MHLRLRLGGARDRNSPLAYTKAATGIQNAGVPSARLPWAGESSAFHHCAHLWRWLALMGTSKNCRYSSDATKLRTGRDIPRQPGVTAVVKIRSVDMAFRPRPSSIGKFANSVSPLPSVPLGCNPFFKKFPAPLRREFCCKPLNSLADWARKSSREARIL